MRRPRRVRGPRLRAVARFDIPVNEPSSLDVRTSEGDSLLLCVGACDAGVSAAAMTGDGLGPWRGMDLAGFDGWKRAGLGAGAGRVAATATDGAHLLAFLREDEPTLVLADTGARRLTHVVALTVPPSSPIHEDWQAQPGRGRGLVLLRGGHVLVAKQEQPMALMEMGPPGDRPLGLRRASLLGPGEPFQRPVGDRPFMALAAWFLGGRAASSVRDISDLATDEDSVWLLSGRSKTLARLRLDGVLPAGSGNIRVFDQQWRLPRQTSRPAGVAVLRDRVLLALGTRQPGENGLVLEAPRR